MKLKVGVGLLEAMRLKPAPVGQRPALTGADPSAPARSATTGAALLRLQYLEPHPRTGCAQMHGALAGMSGIAAGGLSSNLRRA